MKNQLVKLVAAAILAVGLLFSGVAVGTASADSCSPPRHITSRC